MSVKTEIGDEAEAIEKAQSLIEEKAYRDTWGGGLDTYMSVMFKTLTLLRDLLRDTGSLYIHVDWHAGHYMKLLLDEIFGYGSFKNQIIWWYYDKFPTGGNVLDRQHDFLLQYTKSKSYKANKVMEPRVQPGRPTEVRKKVDGKMVRIPDLETGKTTFVEGTTEKKISDVWRIPLINSMSSERLGYATQKPETLLERVIAASSNEGDIVADFFLGSGTTMAVAEKLGRRWIGCDLGRYAIHTTRKRLMDIPDCRPFEILNLGRYERQVWQGVAFGGRKQTEQMLVFEYLKFILELYGAQPLAGTQHLHGKRGAAVVHVGAVDAPVTIDEVNACLAECLAMGQKELHILGWEWEMGLANLMVGEARRQGIKLLLLAIPREVMEQQAVDKGDIHFYELAYLEARIATTVRSVTVELADFVIPSDELIPADVREKIGKWSDYVDYWAVDWDFRDDTFVNGWTSYRTRQDRTLALRTEAHTYDAPGTYHVLVKAIDIFGNDTSQRYEVVIP